MVRARIEVPVGSQTEIERYGLGFWLHGETDTVMMEGGDPGVSFRSACDPREGVTHTVISNTSGGAWPLTRVLEEQLG